MTNSSQNTPPSLGAPPVKLGALGQGLGSALDQNSQTSGNALQAIIAAMAKNVRDRYYKGQTIYLDGYSFTNCCFHNCVLVTESGAFTLHECTVIGVSVQYGPNAVRIVQLYNLLAGPGAHASLNPVIGADGSATIR